MIKKKKRKGRPSRVIGLRAFEVEDADIIAWWTQHLEPTKRSMVLRNIIRAHLVAQDQPAVDPAAEIAALRAELEEIKQTLAVMVRLIKQGVRVEYSAEQAPSDPFAQDYAEAVLNRQW